jgi:hypothetical protein
MDRMQHRSRRAELRRAAQVRRVTLVCGLFAVMIVATLTVEKSFDGPIRKLLVTRRPADVEVSHVGTIRLAPDRRGICPEMQFDNDTGVLSPAGASRCDPNDPSPQRWGSGGTTRMDTIRQGFRNR